MRARRAVVSALALAAAAAGLGGCRRGHRAARLGDVVQVNYEAYVDGKLFESNKGQPPAKLKLGSGALPDAAERSLIGLEPGDRAEVKIRDAYGPRDPKKVQAVPLKSFGPLAKQLAPGKLVLGTIGGRAAEATVLRVDKSTVWLDFNHRLAGKLVEFKLQLVSIEK